jgi:hypothetical protein
VKSLTWWIICALVVGVCLPSEAAAHDDPVITVRVMCNGFNVLDMNAVLGEFSDSAMLNVDREVHGPGQVEQWVKEQMDKDLRIEIIDIGTPAKLEGGYSLAWTARFSRHDWSQAGIGSRRVSSRVVIQNGRITEWTAHMADDPGDGASLISDPATVPDDVEAHSTGMPEVFGAPISLVLAGLLALVGAVVVLRPHLRR